MRVFDYSLVGLVVRASYNDDPFAMVYPIGVASCEKGTGEGFAPPQRGYEWPVVEFYIRFRDGCLNNIWCHKEISISIPIVQIPLYPCRR